MAASDRLLRCPVAFANHTVYAAARDLTKVSSAGWLYALDPATGTTRWARTLGGSGAFTPSVSNGAVYVGIAVDVASGVRPWSLAAFDAKTGRQLWRTAVGQSKYLPWASAAVADGRVVFASPAGRLLALNAKTGRYLWNVPFSLTSSSPAIANGVVYIGSPDKHLYASDLRTGRRLWSAATPDEISTSSPTVAGGTVIVGCDDGVVRAFRVRPTR